jgi:aspartate aminotransferase
MVLQHVSRSLLRKSASSKQSLARTHGVNSARWMSSSPWADFEMAPLDPIVGLNETFQKDDFPQKVIVGVGAYRDDMGKPYVLPVVREAEKLLMDKQLDMEYTGIVSGIHREPPIPMVVLRRTSGLCYHRLLIFFY